MATKASEVATELRKIADALDTNPQARMPTFHVYASFDDKQLFADAARTLPHPLKKWADLSDSIISRFHVGYKNKALQLDVSIYRDKICKVIEPSVPAVYECEPLFSEDEEVELIPSSAE